MEANHFISKLKAVGTDAEPTKLDKTYDNYKITLSGLSAKDKGLFSLNVLCTVCRNLDKLPTWKDSVDWRALLTLAIHCVRETRPMERSDRVKTLACIYHIHKYVVKQPTTVPPELVLKISFMPFEVDTKHLLTEYNKTYWSILTDRLAYFEKLKHKRTVKLIPKLTEDLLKTIDIYDTVQFCSNMLLSLVKKLYYVFQECRKELNELYFEIFKKISSKDLKPFQNLNQKDNFNLYEKFNECLYVIAENLSKLNFEHCKLDMIVRYCVTILGHSPAFFHCFQTFYSNALSIIFTSDNIYTQTVLNGLLIEFETTEKLYKKVMMLTYPFINKFLLLYIEHKVTNHTKAPWKDYFDVTTQEICLTVMLTLMKKQRKCTQSLKCCQVQSGLHDLIRLSGQLNNFIKISLTQKLLLTDNQSLLLSVIKEQYIILMELKDLGCTNFDKYFRKTQADIHNCAISLNKALYYEFSCDLLEIYIKHEISYDSIDYRNIARALYNKGICELNNKQYRNALIDAYLSLIFSQNEGFITDKYMSLVMEIKSNKANREMAEDSEENVIQCLTVMDAWIWSLENYLYGIRNCLQNIPFKELLEYEYKMYCKFWPSAAPIAGVWKSLLQIYHNRHKNIYQGDQEKIFWTLAKIILDTTSTVRTIHNDHFRNIIIEILEIIGNKKMKTDLQIIRSALLFLNTEYSLAAASNKYGWKTDETIETSDPDLICANRTLSQEHNALVDSFKALEILTELIKQLRNVKNQEYLRSALPIYKLFVYQFLHLWRITEALQLAYICCEISDFINDIPTYIRNAGVILYHSVVSSPQLDNILHKSVSKFAALISKEHLETAIVFLCDKSMYYMNIGSIGKAAKLAQWAQAKILKGLEKHPEINLEIAIGRLMETQTLIYETGPNILTAVSGAQKHLLGISSTDSKWALRRAYSLSLRYNISRVSIMTTYYSRRLQLRRRATAAAVASLPAASAVGRAKLYLEITDTALFDDAQVKIDSHLKYTLGLKPTNEIQPSHAPPKKQKTSQLIEPMRENVVFGKNQTSPTLPFLTVPSFKIYDFLLHNNCNCYACSLPISLLLACQVTGQEASMYFKAQENVLAEDYFEGALKTLQSAENKFRGENGGSYEFFLRNNVQEILYKNLKIAEIEILIDLCFFELKRKMYSNVDENITRIHDILQELGRIDEYLKSEIFHLMAASAQARKSVQKSKFQDIEIDFEKLKINMNEVLKTPIGKTIPPPASKINNLNEVFKTPIGKTIPPPASIKKVKDEETYRKRKVIKLNLDECRDDDFEIPKKKTEFKIPEPKVTKQSLELATPIPNTEKKPTKILLTQPSTAETPKTEEELEFFESDFEKLKIDMNEVLKTPIGKTIPPPASIINNLNEVLKTPIGKTIPPPASIINNLNEVLKTPIGKTIRPPASIIKVKDEETYRKRKDIKLNLDECRDDDFEIPKKTTEFKIPEPKVTKKSLELATPIPNTEKKPPKILVTQPSTEETPKTEEELEFFTPRESPRQLFTPLPTIIKKYPKNSHLRYVVRNLESEFSILTPKTVVKDSLKVPTGQWKTKVKKRRTSGKVCKAKKKSPVPIARRLFTSSSDEDD